LYRNIPLPVSLVIQNKSSAEMGYINHDPTLEKLGVTEGRRAAGAAFGLDWLA